MAAYDTFDVTITGVGGHAGGLSENVRDPVIAASQAVVMLQSIVSRNIGPLEPAVLSVTEIRGGTAYNVIPEKVWLRGCTRHLTPHTQEVMERRMREVLKGLDAALGVSTVLNYQRRCPAVINSQRETEEALRAASLVAGRDNIDRTISPVMNSEDFSYMLNCVPGAFLLVGAGQPRTPNGSNHQPGYDFNDRLLSIGASYWVSLVGSLLPEK